MSEDLKKAALEYHAKPRPGKISVEVTKPAKTSRDLSLAYSPGVAEPVREIAREPELAYRFTSKGNLVAVISDGTAILGLGNLGALASKPVMEGKGILFKLFAGIDVFDIEVDAEDPQAFTSLSMIYQRLDKIDDAEKAQAKARMLSWKQELKTNPNAPPPADAGGMNVVQ